MPPRHAILVRGLRILQSYGVDWLLAVFIAVFANFYLDRFQNIPDFDLTDTTIQYSFKAKEVFPNSTLAYILAFSYVLLVISNLILSRNMWDLHHALLGLTVAFSLVGTFEQLVRITVGRPRPDFIARCNPFDNAANGHFFGLANTTVCQTPATDPLIKDGMRSFFSGHACLSAVGLGFNSLYWAGKLQLFNRKSYTSKAWLVFSPLMVSIYICITRVTDHRHHWEDVTVGFFAGIIPTYVFYRQFYPGLEDPHSNLPYSPRHASAESGRGPSRTWGNWFSTPDEGPTPLLPTNRSNREMRDSTSNLGHVEVELDSGLIATPYNPPDHEQDMAYSGMPKPVEPHSARY
ncbi:Diacylglycerol pyrophosphate phosphatase 1 Short-DGPP phosphatase [Mycena venus]|uniref:Diacylglycerol pyrophosphate phosphatase 1 Short-DGPP phosphatase n=1 Tax=Mycena venus TaxID=2733690 RepID=A0A8H6X8Z9_9AGAR|nr:Diacylglycerol pyrophosphate phosphatase 1 Short-DGPP phosphatase [Mycena venus]